jgi:hypothetical protein
VNNQLYGKVWQFPQHMQQHMKICFAKVKNADANVEGYNRNRRLQSANQVGYPELKRIKNFFDSHKGNPQDAPFILNGENKMKDFVNSILSGARQSLSTSKEIRNNTGMDGSKPELADPNVNLNISQDTANKSTIEKYDLQVTESLKRINDLITKLL